MSTNDLRVTAFGHVVSDMRRMAISVMAIHRRNYQQHRDTDRPCWRPLSNHMCEVYVKQCRNYSRHKSSHECDCHFVENFTRKGSYYQ